MLSLIEACATWWVFRVLVLYIMYTHYMWGVHLYRQGTDKQSSSFKCTVTESFTEQETEFSLHHMVMLHSDSFNMYQFLFVIQTDWNWSATHSFSFISLFLLVFFYLLWSVLMRAWTWCFFHNGLLKNSTLSSQPVAKLTCGVWRVQFPVCLGSRLFPAT